MGKVYLCAGKMAETPFLIKNMDIRVYSVEELCYCIGEYTFLVDDKMMEPELVDWIGEECGMGELALMLRRLLENKSSFALFFGRLLYYVGYQEADEVERIGQFIGSNENIDPIQRRKNVADYLATTERYESALKQYHMLYYDLPHNTTDAMRGAILHNMGVVNARLFRFREASRLFKRAFELNKERESRSQYLSAVRLWYTMEDTDGRFGMKRYMELVASGGEAYHDMSVALEFSMENIKTRWEKSEVNHLLNTDLEDAGDNEKAVISVLADESDRIRNAYRQMIRE